MTETTKQQLQKSCTDWLGQSTERSQSSLARMTGINQSYISQVVNAKWTDRHPSIAQWNKIARFFNVEHHIDSINYRSIIGACKAAQTERDRIGIDGYTGAGKTYALRAYMKANAHVYMVQSDPTMTRRAFVQELARQVGVAKLNSNLYNLLQDVISKLEHIDHPVLLIFDEIEYLPLSAYNIVKTLMDKLEGKVGFVISGIYKEWLRKAAAREKPGMSQFLRRIGHSWVNMQEVNRADIKSICTQNDIENSQVIKWLATNVSDYDSLTTYVRDLVKVADNSKAAITPELCAELFR